MRLVLRLLLVWLMVLALPVQGFAVAAMVHCGPAPVSSAAEAVDAEAAASHAHHHPAEAAAVGAHADVHGQVAAAGDPAPGGHQCSVCAACCLALAIPATVVKLQPVLVDATFLRSALPALPSFVPAGLDRPPRPILA